MRSPLPLLAIAAACAAHGSPAPSSGTPVAARPHIALATGSPRERATQAQLARLLDTYDLSPWQYTHELVIAEGIIPHSAPVLTLSTRHLRDDDLLLATYVHEQSHWYFERHAPALAAAVAELEHLVPQLPVGYPDGADDLEASYLHLAVNAFEYHALQQLVGELRAHTVLAMWTTDHYRAIYRIVLDRHRELLAVLRRHGLEPPRRPG